MVTLRKVAVYIDILLKDSILYFLKRQFVAEEKRNFSPGSDTSRQRRTVALRLKKLSSEFSTLSDPEKDYILSLTRALSSAVKPQSGTK